MPQVVDVRLPDDLGQHKFNPPSPLGAGQRQRFFHDGPATSWEEVFTHHAHQVQTDLAAEQIAELAEFLRSL
jgi:hypothetical protein